MSSLVAHLRQTLRRKGGSRRITCVAAIGLHILRLIGNIPRKGVCRKTGLRCQSWTVIPGPAAPERGRRAHHQKSERGNYRLRSVLFPAGAAQGRPAMITASRLLVAFSLSAATFVSPALAQPDVSPGPKVTTKISAHRMEALKKCTDGIKFDSDKYVACMTQEKESP
jgi:hypothetical protein